MCVLLVSRYTSWWSNDEDKSCKIKYISNILHQNNVQLPALKDLIRSRL